MPNSIVSVRADAYSNGELAFASPLHACAKFTSCGTSMRGKVFGTFSAACATDSGYTFGLFPYVSYVRIPFEPTNTPPPPSPRGSVMSSGRKGGRGGIRPPSYQYTFTGGCAGLRPSAFRSGNSYCTVVASGYVAGFCAPPPHGDDDPEMLVG